MAGAYERATQKRFAASFAAFNVHSHTHLEHETGTSLSARGWGFPGIVISISQAGKRKGGRQRAADGCEMNVKTKMSPWLTEAIQRPLSRSTTILLIPRSLTVSLLP